MKTECWLIDTIAVAIDRGYRLALLKDWRIRVYGRDGMTKYTFVLDDFTDRVQEIVVDMIYPYID